MCLMFENMYFTIFRFHTHVFSTDMSKNVVSRSQEVQSWIRQNDFTTSFWFYPQFFIMCYLCVFIAVVNQLFMAEYWIACNVPLTSTHSVTPNDWVVSKKYTFLRLSSCRNFYVFSVVAHFFSNVDTGMLPVSGSTDCSASILKILLSSLSSLHSNSMTSQ